MAEKKSELQLAKMISGLREELRAAQGDAGDLRFLVEDIELEVQFTTTKDVEGKTGVKFWVYTAEAGGGIAVESMQKMKLKLKLADSDTLISASGERPE
ncbi:MAG: trypco2 family protein [Verrucomicrobiota bacterium]